MGSDRKMDSKTDSEPASRQVPQNRLSAVRCPLHDNINISQRDIIRHLKIRSKMLAPPRHVMGFGDGGQDSEHFPACSISPQDPYRIDSRGAPCRHSDRGHSDGEKN
jgi:hypothetical protein